MMTDISPSLSQAQLAYLAGYIDGDGCVRCQKQVQQHGATPSYVLRLSFVAVTREPLETFSKWLGGVSIKKYPPATERRSERYRLRLTKGKALPLLKACLPYLILKRRQAELVLEIEAVRKAHSPSSRHFGKPHFERMPQGAIDQMEVLYQELRSLKSNKRPGCKGHKKGGG